MFPSILPIVIVLLLLPICLSAQSFIFRKINSGTKSDIRNIMQDKQQGVYFVTDKIHALVNETWKNLSVPVDGKIYFFNPLSDRDFWFNINQLTNTCMLYHFNNGITESIRPPLSNSITSIYFISEDKALFAGFADVAVYENGTFRMLPPSPAHQGIVKIFAADLAEFYMLTGEGELFLFQRGKYKKILGDKRVTDFCYTGMQDGYVLSGDELFRADGSGEKLVCRSADFMRVNKTYLMGNGTLLMAGDKGLVMSFVNGRLQHHEADCTENLTDLTVTGSNEIWICGDNGRLLYSGEKQFPAYIEENQGFSSYKLIVYGINADDEYGVAMADFTGDEKTDIYTVRIYEQNRLYINNLSPSFELASINGFSEEAVKRSAIGLVNTENSPVQSELKLGITAADIDNDNDQDIYLCYLNSINKLLLNRGDGYFRNVSTQKNRATGNIKRSNAAAFSDIDNDGDLDLFVTSEEGSNRLFENDGTGHFSDITTSSGLSSAGGGMCASFADVNNDGYPDLCVTFWYPSNRLYFNESKKGRVYFRDVTQFTDLAKAEPAKSNGVAFADVNNDGFPDLFIANRNTGNKLYLNNGTGIFIDKTPDYFQPDNKMSNGAVFADFDLDGYQDLYVTNVGENVLYKNMNGSCFTDFTADFGAELSGYCTGCATGDIDDDGDPDLYVANYINGNSNLFLNIAEKKCFVRIKLAGVRSNRDAIGAKVWLYRASAGNEPKVLAGYREMNAGSGYASVSAKEMIFGVVQGREYFVLVKFPSSSDTIRIDHIIAGSTLKISEMKGVRAYFTRMVKNTWRFFMDQENQPEIVKYLLVIGLIIILNLKLFKSNRKVAALRWLTSGFIFSVFVFVNHIFLFQFPAISFFIAPLIVLGLLAIEYLFIDRLLIQRLAQKENLELREKLSRDLHDDLASTLGSISLYAETLKGLSESSQQDYKKLPVKIAGLAQSALQSISDIIWMTSPRNDSLQNLVSKTSNYMFEILSDNKINFQSGTDIADAPVILREKIRNDAFLILKEGLHNIIRHSGAKNVEFSAVLKDGTCTIALKDDGIGIDESRKGGRESHGNGLINMRKRALESGIEFSIHSGPGKGTTIVLRFQI